MIHAFSIISNTGKLIISRQFTHQNRSKLESELAAFPKLAVNSHHSYIDTEDIRFIYQEVNDMYILIIVSKDMNIIESLEALSLFINITRDIVGEIDITEDKIVEKGLDLIFAYDECVFDGFKQNFDVTDIKKFLEMESEEEKQAIREREEKELRAAEELKRKMEELETQKAGKGMQYSSGNSYGGGGYILDNQPVRNEEQVTVNTESTPKTPHRVGMSLSRKGPNVRIQQVLDEESKL